MDPKVDLNGYIVNDNKNIQLICDSNVKSYRNSATFLVNDEVRQYIKLIDDTCTDISGHLCENICGCNGTSKILFLDISDYDTGPHKFGCNMRFEGVDYVNPIEAKSTLSFNGTDFQPLPNVIIQKDTNVRIPDTQTLPFIASAIAAFMVILAFIIVVVCIHKRIKATGDDSIKEPVEIIPFAGMTDEQYKVSCQNHSEFAAWAFCADCKTFFCKPCCHNHRRTFKDHDIQGIHIEYLNQKQIAKTFCECGNKPILICQKCKNMYCANCHCDHVYEENYKIYLQSYKISSAMHTS